jgi:hypothetical protein
MLLVQDFALQSDRHLGEAQPGFSRAKGTARSSAPAQCRSAFGLPGDRVGSLQGAELAPSAQSPALAAGFTATVYPARNLHGQLGTTRKLNSTQLIENNHSGSRQITTTLGALWAQPSRMLSEAPAKRCGDTPFLLATADPTRIGIPPVPSPAEGSDQRKPRLLRSECICGPRELSSELIRERKPAAGRDAKKNLPATLPRVEFALTHSQLRGLIFLPATRCGFLELAFPPAPYALRIDGAKGTVRASRHTSRGSRVARHILYANLLQSEAAG